MTASPERTGQSASRHGEQCVLGESDGIRAFDLGDDQLKESLKSFFEALRGAGGGVLALDYDGTLAPFRIDPMEAVPYAGVREAITGFWPRERRR